jgi:hypothetical protein
MGDEKMRKTRKEVRKKSKRREKGEVERRKKKR